MVLSKKKNLRLYYSIKDVAREVGVNETTLRYWESEIPKVSPKKGNNGIRQYNSEDIKMIKMVYNLIKVRGMTIQGVKQYLKNNTAKNEVERDIEVVERLKFIKQELLEIDAALMSL